MKTRRPQHIRPALRPRASAPPAPIQRRMAARTASGLEELGYDPEPTMKLSRALFIVVVMHVIAVGGMYLFQHLKETREGSAAASVEAPYEDPAIAAGVGSGALPSAPVARSRAGIHMHYVEVGQSLSEIARLYGTTIEDLAAENGLDNPEVVYPGQELRVPSAAATPPPLDIEALTSRRPDAAPEREVRAAAAETAKPAASAPKQTGTAAAVSESSPAESALRQQFLASKGRAAPATASPAPTAARPAAGSAANASRQRSYVVKKGDNPVAIAREFGVSYSELLRVNGIDDPRRLQIGQTLKIPGS